MLKKRKSSSLYGILPQNIKCEIPTTEPSLQSNIQFQNVKSIIPTKRETKTDHDYCIPLGNIKSNLPNKKEIKAVIDNSIRSQNIKPNTSSKTDSKTALQSNILFQNVKKELSRALEEQGELIRVTDSHNTQHGKYNTHMKVNQGSNQKLNDKYQGHKALFSLYGDIKEPVDFSVPKDNISYLFQPL